MKYSLYPKVHFKSSALWQDLHDTFSLQMKQLCVIRYFIDELSSVSVIYRGTALSRTGLHLVLSAGPSKPEKLLFSTLHLQTDSNFTRLACRKWDWVSFFLRHCLGPARLGVGYTPGENSVTAGARYKQRQACCTVASVVNF